MPNWNYSDDFTNGGGNFTKRFGCTVGLYFSDGAVHAGASHFGGYSFNSDGLSSDHDAYINPLQSDYDEHDVGVMLRFNGTDCYVGMVSDSSGGTNGDEWTFNYLDSSGIAVLDGYQNDKYNNGSALKCRIVGSSLTMWQSTTQTCTLTDSAISSGVKAGIYLHHHDGFGTCTGDNFAFTNVPACPEIPPTEFSEHLVKVWLPLRTSTINGISTTRIVNPLRLRTWYDDAIFDRLNQNHACMLVLESEKHKFTDAVPESAVDSLTVAKWNMIRRLRRNAYLVKAGSPHPKDATEWHTMDHTWRCHKLANGDKVYYRDDPYTTPSIAEIEANPAEVCGGPDDNVERLMECVPARSKDEKRVCAALIETAVKYHVKPERALDVARRKGVQDLISKKLERKL